MPTDSVTERFSAKVHQFAKRNGGDRNKAVFAVARRHPKLHVQYLLATNPDRAAQRLIVDKYFGEVTPPVTTRTVPEFDPTQPLPRTPVEFHRETTLLVQTLEEFENDLNTGDFSPELISQLSTLVDRLNARPADQFRDTYDNAPIAQFMGRQWQSFHHAAIRLADDRVQHFNRILEDHPLDLLEWHRVRLLWELARVNCDELLDMLAKECHLISDLPLGQSHDSDQLVTLSQIAAILPLKMSKSGISKRMKKAKFPVPDVRPGQGSGKPNLYSWQRFRPLFEEEFKVSLPNPFPRV